MGIKSPRQRLIIRSAAIFGVLVLIGFGASLRSLVSVQFIHGEVFRAKAELNQIVDELIPAKRGTIYDCNGRVLAQSASVWKIYINPKKIAALENEGMREELIEKLSAILEVDAEKVRKLTYQDKLEYAEVKTKVEFDKKEEIVQLRQERYYKNPGDKEDKGIPYSYVVGIRDDEKRYYPYGNFASGIIGFCGADGGSFGLEKSCDALLKGTPGRMTTVKNAGNDTIPFQLETIHPVQQGANLMLTIDEHIQNYLESDLDEALISTQGKGAYGIVMDVKTGAILAMAGAPGYDLNEPEVLTDKALEEQIKQIQDPDERSVQRNAACFAQWTDYCTQKTYEPGSVFKVFVTAAAMEEKAWSMTEGYTCTGSIHVKDRTIACHVHSGHGTQNLPQALINSCNPFFVTVGLRLGVDKFYKYFEAFGFTEKTGIEIDETAPVKGNTYHIKEKMSSVELASSSFGQSFEVTPLQMITAVSAIANGGKLMKPYLVAKQLDDAGNIVSVNQPYVRRQVISATTAATLSDMMVEVVDQSPVGKANVPGYRVAGKSGTAEKLGEKDSYVASFTSFAPADDPKIAVLILVDEPVGQIYGGWVAAPIAADIVGKTLKYMNVEPKYTAEDLAEMKRESETSAAVN